MHDRADRKERLEGFGARNAGPLRLLQMRRDFALRLRPFRRDEGQAIVEFALVVPFLLALVLLLVDFGKVTAYWLNVTQVASEGARVASVNAPCSTATADGICDGTEITDIQAYLQKELDPEVRNGSLNVGPHAGATISVCYPDGRSSVGDPVRVTISTHYRPTLLSFLGGGFSIANIPLKGSATMRLEHAATNAALTGGAC
jgi:hypothetical protein